MRKNSKFGVLSDEYIKNNYADCFLPVRVDKLHSIRQKPASSYVNTSGKRVKEYNSIAPVIPYFVAQNNTKSKGVQGQNEMNAIKSDLIRTSANAESNYSILQPPRKREGLLQEDIGFVKISSMANAQDPNFGKIDKDFVGDELEDQAPLGAYGDKADLNTILGSEAPRHKEDMVFAGRGAKPEMAKILDPSVSSKLFIADELKRQPQSALFAKPEQATEQQAPTDLLAQQQGRPNTIPSMQTPVEPPVEPPVATPVEPPVEPVTEPVTEQTKTLDGQPLSTIKGDIVIYKNINEAKSLKQIPSDKDSIEVLKNFLAENLRTSYISTEKRMKDFLDTLKPSQIKQIRRKYFKKSAGAPANIPRAPGAGRPPTLTIKPKKKGRKT